MTAQPTPRPPLDRSALAGSELDVEVLAETASTNAVAVERARTGAPEGLVVAADHQSAGRGRLDRSWETPPGTAVTFSLVLRPVLPPRSWPWLPLLTGRAVASALRERGVDAGVKWPNDVLVGGRKIAGILVERIETAEGPAAVVGVGVNTSMRADELPVPHATSLAVETGQEPDRAEVLLELVRAVRSAYDEWQAGGEEGGARLAVAYARACVTVGQDVRVDLPGGTSIEGRATGVDAAGQLVVATAAGERRVGAGDVVHVKRRQ